MSSSIYNGLQFIPPSKESGLSCKKSVNVNPTPIHKKMFDGNMIWWYEAERATMKTDYKEKGRITPVVRDLETISKSGYGNEFLADRI